MLFFHLSGDFLKPVFVLLVIWGLCLAIVSISMLSIPSCIHEEKERRRGILSLSNDLQEVQTILETFSKGPGNGVGMSSTTSVEH